jgi:hypothetical protein
LVEIWSWIFHWSMIWNNYKNEGSFDRSMTHCSQHQKVLIWLSNWRWSFEIAKQIGTLSCWSISDPKCPCQCNTDDTTQPRSDWGNLLEESQTRASMREFSSFLQGSSMVCIVRDLVELERQKEFSTAPWDWLTLFHKKFSFFFSPHNLNSANL